MTETHECVAMVHRLLNQDGMVFVHRVGCDAMSLTSYECTCGLREELAEQLGGALGTASREADALVPRALRGRVMSVIRDALRASEEKPC